MNIGKEDGIIIVEPLENPVTGEPLPAPDQTPTETPAETPSETPQPEKEPVPA